MTCPTRWQQQIVIRSDELLCRRDRLLAALPADAGRTTDALLANCDKLVALARRTARVDSEGNARKRTWRQRLDDVVRGAAEENAFVTVHSAEVLLVDLYRPEDVAARTPDVLARLRAGLPAGDGRLEEAERRLLPASPQPAGSPSTPEHTRAAFQAAMKLGYELTDEAYVRLRSFRNVLFGAMAILSLLALALAVTGLSRPTLVPLCFTMAPDPPTRLACPTAENVDVPQPADIAVVVLLGVVGGALSAALSVQALRGTSAPYAVSVPLTILKLPAGAITAVAGLIFLHGEFVPGLSSLDRQGRVLAYAVLLGFAQHLATRVIDRRATDLLSTVPSKQPEVQVPSADRTATTKEALS